MQTEVTPSPYEGFSTPTGAALRLTALTVFEGPEAALARLASLFAGPPDVRRAAANVLPHFVPSPVAVIILMKAYWGNGRTPLAKQMAKALKSVFESWEPAIIQNLSMSPQDVKVLHDAVKRTHPRNLKFNVSEITKRNFNV